MWLSNVTFKLLPTANASIRLVSASPFGFSLLAVHPDQRLLLLLHVPEAVSVPGGGGYSITFNTGRSLPIFGVRNFTLNQYLGSVNYNMDKNSIFCVHKSEKRKNRGVWCESPRYQTQYLGSPKH